MSVEAAGTEGTTVADDSPESAEQEEREMRQFMWVVAALVLVAQLIILID